MVDFRERISAIGNPELMKELKNYVDELQDIFVQSLTIAASPLRTAATRLVSSLGNNTLGIAALCDGSFHSTTLYCLTWGKEGRDMQVTARGLT
jgi:hypothetical protein